MNIPLYVVNPVTYWIYDVNPLYKTRNLWLVPVPLELIITYIFPQ